MSTQQQTKQKILINCQDGLNNVERATIAFILAVTASKTNETAMFVNAEASALCVEDTVQDLVAPGYEPLADLMEVFISNGGKIWLCPACVKAKNIDPEKLIDGVEIAGAPRAMAYLASGGQLLA